MPVPQWRPSDEAEAAGTPGAFVEWLRATGAWVEAAPHRLRGWAGAEPAAFASAIAGFAGLKPAAGVAANLLRRRGGEPALVMADGVRGVWSYTALAERAGPPPPLAATLARLEWAGLIALAGSHLLVADTRPDDRIVWAGAVSDPWPMGAWLIGATLVLPGSAEPASVARAEHGVVVAAAPPPWVGGGCDQAASFRSGWR